MGIVGIVGIVRIGFYYYYIPVVMLAVVDQALLCCHYHVYRLSGVVSRMEWDGIVHYHYSRPL